ncbi:MAG TPA: SDR family oxidoreductase [Terriglobales bacterium]|jgi:3-oxoacyl-[acyl-carrier protein] reductase|nr:SDR family oxidoreductase [Terriglobales bacterium]
MPIQLNLSNQVALITGGSRGIGAAAVKMFVVAGAKVVFNYLQAQKAAEQLVRECGEANCAAVQIDLNGSASGGTLVEAAIQRFGRLDILVANHGVWVSNDKSIDQMSDEQWRSTLAINLDSVFGLVKHAVAQMKVQIKAQTKKQPSGGNIVLISSTAAQRGEAFHCDYAASKGALISMVKGLSTELAADGIRVNCVAPGWVATDMSAPALNDPSIRERIFKTIPLGRVATPEEIAAPVLFLCSEHAGFITGEIFNVNGGAVLVG